MTLTIKFIGALRLLSGKKELTLPFQTNLTIKSIVEQISQEHPALKHTFSDDALNNARSNSLILVNGKEISILNGYETQLCDGDEVVFVPVVHGG